MRAVIRRQALPKPGFVARTLDSIVAAAFPSWGLRRVVARARHSALLSYDAARRDRVRSVARSGSADSDLLPDLRILREKSRSLVRDDAHAAASIRVLVENVVGCGLRPQAAARPEDTGLTQAQCDDWNASVERLWNDWALRSCDANRIGDFDELTRLVYRTRLVDGEALAHRVVRDGVAAWELVDVDRLDDPQQVQTNIRMGVELGAFGDPIAYWITPTHPNDLRFLRTAANNWPERYVRFMDGWPNVLHVYRRDRPGQSRGVPAITAAMPLFEHLHHYLDSEIIAARANANVAMVIKRPVDRSDPDLAAALGDLGPNSDGSSNVVYHQTVEPGTIEYLNEGEEMQSFMPNRPGTSFDPFVTRVLRAIAGALGLPYEMVVKDFGSMNYSSARVALLESRRGFESEQQLIIDNWCRPCWETRLREAIVKRELPSFPQMLDPKIGVAPFLEARWIRGAWGWVDPVKEIEASRQAVEANLATPQGEASRAGMDAEEILEARARFLAKAREIEERFDLDPGTLTAVGGPKAPPPATPSAAVPADDSPDDSQDAAGDQAAEEPTQ